MGPVAALLPLAPEEVAEMAAPTDDDTTPNGGLSTVPDGAPAFAHVPPPAGAGADDESFDGDAGYDDPEGFDPSIPDDATDSDFDAFASAGGTQDIPGPPPAPVTPELSDEDKAEAKRVKRQEKLFALGSLEGDPDVTPQTWIPDEAVVDTKVVMKGGAVALEGGSLDWGRVARCFVVAEVQGRQDLVVRHPTTREPTGDFEETITLRPTHTQDIEKAMRDPSTGLLALAKRILAERGELSAAA